MTKKTDSAIKKEESSKTPKQPFFYFKSYSGFILQHHLDKLIRHMLEEVNESKGPILELISKISSEEIVKISKVLLTDDILIPVQENHPFDQLIKKIQIWKENKGTFSPEDLQPTNIFFINNAIKKGLVNFIKYYDISAEEKNNLIEEIENYFEKSMGLVLKTYEEIHQEKIYSKSVSNDEHHNLLATQQQETKDDFLNLIEGVKDYAIFRLNIDGTIASWNQGAEYLKGYTKDEIIGKNFSIFYPKEKLDANFPEYELEQAKLNGRYEDEGFRIRKNGDKIWVNVVISTIYNKEGKLTGFTKITRDLLSLTPIGAKFFIMRQLTFCLCTTL